MTGSDIRRQFLEFFKKHDHQIVRSSSLVPVEDPTLLFTNAGMVPFKRTFLGEEKRSYVKAASSQKCVRAGGKHNDLENVGYTARHHTFFEMLGNFSFGDYFKEKAIELAWDLLINGYNLPAEKLWVSVYLDDDEAYNIWNKNIGVSEDKIVRLDDKDNFWSMGDTGPCGPCSEILIDRGEKYSCGKPDCRVGCECDRYLEIWNLVFMQYERDASGKLTSLPKPSIDTGMGLERIAAVVQNVPTNYDTDLILPIIKKTEELSQKKFGSSSVSDVAMKVIADHSRATAFLICDGVLPSNEGRGYVLRRIMRRAIRYGRNIGLVKPFLHDTSNVVIENMKEAYSEFGGAEAFIANVIKNEEARFSETLDNGLRLLNDTLSEIKAKGLNTISGDIIFKLYDTYGFPPDIVKDVVRDVVRDEKLFLDMDGFNAAMNSQKEKSRSVASFTGITEAYKNLSANRLIPKFLGYDKQTCDSKVLLIVEDGKEISEAVSGKNIEIVTEETPFYGESGGQAGDSGLISSNNLEIEVADTIKDPAGIIIHKGKILSGSVSKGQTVTLTVDNNRRNATALNHTATHILHSILKQILGDHVKQAGSFVSSERLRFDFTHFSQVDSDTLDKIEMLVNERIRENALTCIEEMDAEKAFKTGATALFEEKYGDVVRVISLGEFSKELCGGTHTDKTGNIGLFKIITESSVASGVRRIEALTGEAALTYVQHSIKTLHETARIVKEKPEALPQKVEKMLSQQKAYEKELEKTKAKIASRATDEIDTEIKSINGVSVLVKKVSAENPAVLRDLADKFRDKIKSGIVVLGSAADSKVFLIVVVTKDLVKKYHAGNIVKQVSPVVGGGGGGRPDMAQAGGSIPEKLDEALAGAYDVIGAIG
ncbi:MAG: alanine--tRNA ligase [Proteobacteria bacterium]|nr:alanine--tRNA ligase [Pseudomonadota bacterium]